MVEKINWGIIGCGDVTELKSGPAFNKVKDSELLAVMRRDAAKAKDYAERHLVSRYYSDAMDMINDPDINAIYIATPPHAHEEFVLAAINVGKPVYVEKPMALNYLQCKNMMELAVQKNVKLVVAHYRSAQPMFIKIKQLLDEYSIGKVMYVKLNYHKISVTEAEMKQDKIAWRLNPLQSGGGLFHDLAPHQLGLMYYFFGEAERVSGISGNLAGGYLADDTVNAIIQYKNGVQFSGSWCFSVSKEQESDSCEIIGTDGSIQFSVFDKQEIIVKTSESENRYQFEALQHVQQPMIEKVVQYFLGREPNPCSPQEGVAVMHMMDIITSKA